LSNSDFRRLGPYGITVMHESIVFPEENRNFRQWPISLESDLKDTDV
jgi:hypothetical protein